MSLNSCLSPGAGPLWCPQTLWQVPGDSMGRHRPGPQPHTVQHRAVHWQALSVGPTSENRAGRQVGESGNSQEQVGQPRAGAAATPQYVPERRRGSWQRHPTALGPPQRQPPKTLAVQPRGGRLTSCTESLPSVPVAACGQVSSANQRRHHVCRKRERRTRQDAGQR